MEDFDIVCYLMGRKAGAVSALPTDTASGNPANFPDGADGIPVVDLKVSIAPVQEGTGDPSPENIRAISGWTGLTLYQSGADTSSPEELTISWEDEAGTVYGGTLDVTTGLLTVTWAERTVDGTESFSLPSSGNYRRFIGRLTSSSWGSLPEYKHGSEAICSVLAWSSAQVATPLPFGKFRISTDDYFIIYDENSEFADIEALKTWLAELFAAGTPMQLCYQIETPIAVQLTPTQVRTLLGENNLWADTGDVTVEYRADLDLYIDKKLHPASAPLGFGMASPAGSSDEQEEEEEIEPEDEDAAQTEDRDGEAPELFEP